MGGEERLHTRDSLHVELARRTRRCMGEKRFKTERLERGKGTKKKGEALPMFGRGEKEEMGAK